MKECPLCGETMRLSVRELRDRLPGTGQAVVRVAREWIYGDPPATELGGLEWAYFEERGERRVPGLAERT